jgi:phenylalanyl-tRNA synthetase alpha chain
LSTALHPMEQKVLAALRASGKLGLQDIASRSGLNLDQVRRAVQWLNSKKLVTIFETASSSLEYSGQPPPELRLVDLLAERGGSARLDSLKQSFASEAEFSAALGRARGAGWIAVEQAAGPATVKVTDPSGPGPLRKLLESLKAGGTPPSASETEEKLFQDLLRRGIARRSEIKSTGVEITGEGLTALSNTVGAGELDRVTSEMLVRGTWKGKRLRPIDVEAEAPRFFPGRRHPVRDFIREVREAYVSMGFEELEGNSVQPAFWNFDALFIPQNHPGREMQDTFYVKGGSDRGLKRKGLVANVAATHESGWRTGSKGWRYSWSIEEARRLVLRTHNTVLSVRALADSGEAETRVFAVSKVYRNENLDYKHLAEFYQMDGIIVGKGLSSRHLIGFLREFYKKLGMSDVKIWPTYFPYTEPSLQIVGYSEVAKDWVELGGSGVFRPEVTMPLGVRVPVLAWGPGIERLMLLRYGLDDIRDIYGDDLGWLRARLEIASSKNRA